MPRDTEINPATGNTYRTDRKIAAWRAEEKAKAKAAKAADPKAAMVAAARVLEATKLQLAAVKSREHLLDFTRFTMPDPEYPNDVDRSAYDDQPFHRKVAEVMTQLIRGELLHDDGRVCRQLIFTMPPRHGKTEMATKRNAAWISGRHPDWDVAVASYSDTMAEDFGADVRSIMSSPRFKQAFPEHGLRRGGAAKANIQTTKGGRLVFVGRGGTLTGRGAHVLLMDDLYKDFEEARSEAIREQAWNWFTKVAMTRRMGPKIVVITMTQWHPDDIVGRITDEKNPHYDHQEAKNWKIIRLPAMAEEDDPLGRAPGEPLWPERYDLEFLQSQQRLDPLGFAALYQQRPALVDGNLFKRETIQRYDPRDLPENLRYYAASDHAVGVKQRNDPSCFGRAGVDAQDNLWFTDIFWERVPTDRAVEQMLLMATGPQAPLVWWAERGHISGSIGPFLRKRMVETGVYLNVVEVTPTVDKAQRAQSIIGRVSLGKVFFPKGSVWDRLVEEMLAFPFGIHDDGVDMLSLFGLGLQSQFRASAPARKPAEPRFGTLAWVKQQDQWAEQRKKALRGGGL